MDRTLRVWNFDDASLVRVIFFPEIIRCFRLTMNGDMAVCGGEEGSIFIWNLTKPILIHSLNFGGSPNLSGQPTLSGPGLLNSNRAVVSVRFSIDERFVVVSTKNRVAYFLTSQIKEEKSKNAFDGYYSGHSTSSPQLSSNFTSDWKSLALNCIELSSNDRIGLAAVSSRNMVSLVIVDP